MKRICVVTGSRSDYGLLKWLINDLSKLDLIDLRIIATGSHFCEKFGYSYKEIIEDGFKIDVKIDILKNQNNNNISEIMSLCIKKISKALKKIEPNMVILLGDRYEIFSVAICAYLARIPIAHIHGGEVTEGAFDEGFRHAITKMSNVHFVANEVYRNRVIRLGEHPSTVFIVGGLGVDAINRIKLYKQDFLSKKLNIKFQSNNLLVTFHPETLGDLSPLNQIKELLAALTRFPEVQIIFTTPNADPGNDKIFKEIEKFIIKNKNALLFKSLGQKKYLSLMSNVQGVVGNSSSGIIEAPCFGVPSLNIGSRQNGRLKASSVIDCANDRSSIYLGIKKILSTKFQARASTTINPYGNGGAAKKIINYLVKSNINLSKPKIFFDNI